MNQTVTTRLIEKHVATINLTIPFPPTRLRLIIDYMEPKKSPTETLAMSEVSLERAELLEAF